MQVVEYDITIAAIQEMKSKYVDLVITDSASYDAVRLAIVDVRDKRVAVEAKRVDLGADALAYGRKVNSTAKEITKLLLEIEDPLKAEKKKEDDRKEAIREAKAQKEKDRVEKIQNRIKLIQACAEPHFLFNKGSETIKKIVSEVMGYEITSEDFQEFEAEARQVLAETVNTLEDAYEARIKFEQEEIERKAEAERLEKQKKEQEEAQAKIDEENRKIQEQKDRIAQEDREKKIKEEAKAQYEKEAIEKAHREAKEKEEREEAEAAEKAQQEGLKPDVDKLTDFANDIMMMPKRPTLKDSDTTVILLKANDQIHEVSKWIKQTIEQL